MEKYSEKSVSVSEKRKLTEVQQYEEDVKNVNKVMDDVLIRKRELEDSHRKQEVLINKISKLDGDNKKAVKRLNSKLTEETTKETSRFESLISDLDLRRAELNTKRNNAPQDKEGVLIRDIYNSKKSFINSVAGGTLMEGMNSQTLKSNAMGLIDQVTEIEARDVQNYDPLADEEYSDTGDMLSEKHGWSAEKK
jgi:hypothetical protein